MILRFLKSFWGYQDATNVVGYYPEAPKEAPSIPKELKDLDQSFFFGNRVVVDPAMALHLLKTTSDPLRTVWVFRYYDLDDRKFKVYGDALRRLIDFIQALGVVRTGGKPRVNIIAHSMGGLLVREVVQKTYPAEGLRAEDFINKIVTLGTPHQGISFQILKSWIPIGAEQEIEHFNPTFQGDPKEQVSYKNFSKYFPTQRLLTVVGTNYKTYDVGVASRMNRLFSVAGEFGLNYNRSDGLVKQTNAQVPGAPRTFVNKCHGGFDSLVTARESFEIATRFFFGNIQARLRMVRAEITRGKDWFGKSEFFFGVSIKPRRVDFDLFHQSAEAENCYGPFSQADLSDDAAFSWAGDERLIWEGYLDTSPILKDDSITPKDMVLRLDFYVGERDVYGVGFSDNVIFRKQYYVRALLEHPLRLFIHTDERFAMDGYLPDSKDLMAVEDGGWEFDVNGTGFSGRFRVELDDVPEQGEPTPIKGATS